MADNDQVRELRYMALAFCANDARDAEAMLRRACEFDMPVGPMPKLRRPFSRTDGVLPGPGYPGTTFGDTNLAATMEEIYFSWKLTNSEFFTQKDLLFLLGVGTTTDRGRSTSASSATRASPR